MLYRFYFISIILLGGIATSCLDIKNVITTESRSGYYIKKDKIIFMYNEYHEAHFEPVESVVVAGDMNGWDPAAPEWQAEDSDGDGIWLLEKEISEKLCGNEFTFVVHPVVWQSVIETTNDEHSCFTKTYRIICNPSEVIIF